MGQSIPGKRPWLAALVTGLEPHCLAQWRHAARELVAGSHRLVDACLLAHAQIADAPLSVTAREEQTHCPTRGKELDPDLEFC